MADVAELRLEDRQAFIEHVLHEREALGIIDAVGVRGLRVLDKIKVTAVAEDPFGMAGNVEQGDGFEVALTTGLDELAQVLLGNGVGGRDLRMRVPASGLALDHAVIELQRGEHVRNEPLMHRHPRSAGKPVYAPKAHSGPVFDFKGRTGASAGRFLPELRQRLQTIECPLRSRREHHQAVGLYRKPVAFGVRGPAGLGLPEGEVRRAAGTEDQGYPRLLRLLE
jgi:hypothetical protein